MLHERGEFGPAVEEIRRALRNEPTNPNNWIVLGDLEMGLGRTAEAVQAYREASRLNSRMEIAGCRIGHACLKLGLLAEALAEFRRIVLLRSSNTDAQCGIGEVHFRLGQFTEALAQAEATLKIDADYAPARDLKERATKALV